MGDSFSFGPRLLISSCGPGRDQIASDLVSALSLLRELPPYRNGVGPGWATRSAHLVSETVAADLHIHFPSLVPSDERAVRALLAELHTALGHLQEARRIVHVLEDRDRHAPLCTTEGRELAAEVHSYAQTVNGLLA